MFLISANLFGLKNFLLENKAHNSIFGYVVVIEEDPTDFDRFLERFHCVKVLHGCSKHSTSQKVVSTKLTVKTFR